MNLFPYKGYAGQYLRVDLTRGVITKLPLPVEWVENYLGGNGMGIRILWDEVPPDVNALSPENKLIIATGALCGSPMPNSGRLEFIAKSPLTGIYGDSNAGGHFGPELKFAGYDLIVLEGRSPEPVILWIMNDKVELRPAGELWGKGVFETEHRLKVEAKDPELKVAAIGPAGENLVLFASIQVTYRRSAARSGMGAVMGSKNLKAIAVRGTKSLPIAQPDKLMDLSVNLHEEIRTNEFFPGTHRFGTSGLVALMHPMGRFPTRNFQFGSFDGFEEISGEILHEKYFNRDVSCYNCPVGCDKVYEVASGEYKGVLNASVEYETLNSLGARICNSNLAAVLKGNEICDDMGMDTISAGAAISFAYELAEKGILPPDAWDGLELKWGDYHAMVELLTRMAYRQGDLADMLAEGASHAARKLGGDAVKYAMHVKGQDISAQDGRAQQSMGLAHVTSNRGADHLKAFPVIDETGYPSEAVRRYGQQYMPELVDPLATQYKAMMVKDGEEYGAVIDSIGTCKSGGTFVLAEVYWQETANAISYITGMEMDESRLKMIGERIYNLQRAYNALHGINKKDDVLPWRFTRKPSTSGNANGSVCHLEITLPDYYRLRQWDSETGLPTRGTMEELGLQAEYDQMQSQVQSGKAALIRASLPWAAPYTEEVTVEF
ncbi:MAG: aldehyde ferredoxin oxidoreductase family protein [Anaerolineaceae bacterium]